jgi:putative ABC transport system permease protein
MGMLQLALKNLWQRRMRSLLTILGVAVGVQLYLAMSSVMASAESDLQDQVNALAGRVFVQRLMKDSSVPEEFPSPSSSINSQVAKALLDIQGVDVAKSSTILYVPLTKPPAPGSPPPTRALGIEPGHEIAFLGPLQVEDGEAVLRDPQSVILGQGAAEYYGKGEDQRVEVGDTIEVLGQPFTVSGMLEPAPVVHEGMVMMDIAVAQALFDRPGSVSAVILTAEHLEDVARIKTEVERLYPELTAATQEEVQENVRAMYASAYDLVDMVNAVAALVVFLFVTIVMIIAVMERRRDIGVLRAIGASRWSIVKMIAIESLILSLAGTLAAGPLWVVIRIFIEVGIGGAADVILLNWLNIGLLAVFAGLGASLLPAWRAVQVDPLEALRYE